MAPMTDKNPAGSVEKNLKSRKMNKQSKMFKFNKYIYQVLKQVPPGIFISCGALKSMNWIITNMMVKLVHKSVKFSLRRRRKSILSGKDILAAVMKIFPPQMAKLASSAARRARTTYATNKLCDAMARTII